MEVSKVSRRKFLQGLGVAAGAAAIVPLWRPSLVSAAENFTGYPDRYGMLSDTTMCIGCRSCEAACNQANGLPAPELPFSDRTVFDEKRRPDAGAWTVVNCYSTGDGDGQKVYRKLQCMHCNEPACVAACPAAALKKMPEGMVIYDEHVCIGCRYCMNACPFSMLSYEYDDAFRPAIRKCLLCYQRVTESGGIPACAEACPTKGTIFGKRSELLRIARERISNNPDKYIDHIYGEHEVGGTSWLYLSAVPFQQLGFPQELGTEPYLEYTRDWLLGVPLVLVMWPALLMGLHKVAKYRERATEVDASITETNEVAR